MTQQGAETATPEHMHSLAPGPIVLGTEFGSVSSAAERVAIRLAKRAGVPLLIVHGIDPGRLRLPGGRFSQRVDQARAARQVDAAALMERVRSAGVEPQLLIWDGDPATCVVEAATAEGASRIVVGSHGRGRLGRAIIGSVSATVAGQAECPVDIVRGDGSSEDIVTVSPTSRRS
ncbi:MAG TPA: universal stress protein [Candidatus Limnocylindrales bacterium]|nr:universal stress protein [Candidatus Limnocylindrales bacterium]